MKFLSLIIILFILGAMLYKFNMWNSLPWAKEAYHEPVLQERSVP